MKYPELKCDDLIHIGSTDMTSYYEVCNKETAGSPYRTPDTPVGTILYISDSERSTKVGEMGVCYSDGDTTKELVFFHCKSGTSYPAYILTELSKAPQKIVNDYHCLRLLLRAVDMQLDEYLQDYIEGLA